MDRKREALLEKYGAQVEQAEARLASLRARAKEARAEGRLAIDRQIERLEARKVVLRQRLDELRGAGEEAWRDVADGAEKAWQSVKDALDQARGRFS